MKSNELFLQFSANSAAPRETAFSGIKSTHAEGAETQRENLNEICEFIMLFSVCSVALCDTSIINTKITSCRERGDAEKKTREIEFNTCIN